MFHLKNIKYSYFIVDMEHNMAQFCQEKDIYNTLIVLNNLVFKPKHLKIHFLNGFPQDWAPLHSLYHNPLDFTFFIFKLFFFFIYNINYMQFQFILFFCIFLAGKFFLYKILEIKWISVILKKISNNWSQIHTLYGRG